MATIIDKPDTLSMSGNIRKFVLGATAPVSFALKKGDAILIERSYEPGADRMITIDVRDVVESQLSYTLDTANEIYSQRSVLGDFTAIIDGESHAFRVIRSGVANLADTPTNWLKYHFLTWQPRVKEVTYYSPEWITYYATEAVTVRVKAIFPDKSSNTTVLKNMAAGECVTFNLQYAIVSRLFANRYPSYYEVWAEAGSSQLTESQFFKFSDIQSEDEQWFLFENSLGGLDTFRASGVNNLQAEHDHWLAELGESSYEYDIDTERKYQKNTGHLDDYARRWLLDFFPSKAKYIHEASNIHRIVVTDSNATYASNDLPSSYTFTYRMADVSSYLNLIRNAGELPDNLIIPDIASPDFILPPRLAELPRQELNEGVLFPAFDPHDPKPTVTSFGQIHDTIKNSVIGSLEDAWRELSTLGGGSGSEGDKFYHIKLDDLTEPTDENGFTAIRVLYEIRHMVSATDDRYIRKDIDDYADGTISFRQDIILEGPESSIYSSRDANSFNEIEGFRIWADGTAWIKDLRVKNDSLFAGSLSSPTFYSGFPNGEGWMIAPYKRTNATGLEETKYKLEIDTISVRDELRVFSFVCSQLLGENDNRIFAGMMEVDHYDPETKRLYLSTDGGRLYNPFRQGDICMVQQFQGDPALENNYLMTKSYEFKVVIPGVGNLSDGEDRLDWVTFENFVGDITLISKRDTVCRVDNPDNSNRSGIMKITTVDEFGTPYLDVIRGMKTDPANCVKVRIGNLNGLVTPYFGRLDGDGGYLENLYARGKFILENTGEDVATKFQVMDGTIKSEIASIRNEVSLKDNYLANASFTQNTSRWSVINDIRMFSVSGSRLLAFNVNFYANKKKVSAIVSDGKRNVLRVKNSQVKQLNTDLANNKVDEIRLPGGEKSWPTFYVSFYCKPITGGTLRVGFETQDLFLEEELTPSIAYELKEFSGKWDGKGDFILGYTGDIHIYALALANHPLDDFRIEMSTRFEETDERIGLYADKLDTLNGTVTNMGIRLDNTESTLEAYVNVTDNYGKTITNLGLLIDGINKDLVLYAKTTDVSSLRKELSAEIKINSDAITQKVSVTDYNGNTIASKVNQTATDYSIEASKINLNGKVTIGMFGDDLKNTIANKADSSSLGSLAYNNAVGKAMLDNTIIVGGFIQASLIDVDNLVARHIDVDEGRLGGFFVNGAVLVGIPDKHPNIVIQEEDAGIWIGRTSGSDILSINCENGRKGLGITAETGSKGIYIDSSASDGIVIDSHGGDAIALRLMAGCIAGLRVKTMRIAGDYTVKDSDVLISCYAPNDIIVTLPAAPQLGDVRFIRRNTDAAVNVSGNGKSIRRDGLYSSVPVGEGAGDMGLFFFDGLCWTYNVLLR